MKCKIFFFMIFFFLSFVTFFNQVRAEDDMCLIDTTAPVISNTHDYHYEIGQPYPDYSEDVVVTDACGYVLEISDDFIDYNQEGTYPLYYYAGDSSGNSSTVSVYVHVHVDITAPVFEQIINRNIEYQQELTDDIFLDGVSAMDNYDGDLTDYIIVDYSSVNVSILGVYPVTYTVIDLHDNSIIETATVTVEDTTPPLISGQRNHTVEVFTENIDYLEEVNADDLYDGVVDIIVDDSQVNLDVVGYYEVILSAIDTNGNSSIEIITVTVVDTTVPVISGQKNYTVEAFIDSINYLEDVSAIDIYDGEVDVVVDDSQVNLDIVGTYEAILSAVDANGNTSTEVITVTVVDTTTPDISGYKNHTIEVLTDSINYLEDVSAIDLYDGEVDILVDDSQVNLNVLGIYEVTLIACDDHLNETQVVLTVTVVDTTPPEISGYQDYTVEVFTHYINYLDNISASDSYDGSVSVIVDDSQVNLNEVGTYEVTLIASDTQGNETNEVIAIYVVDTIPPVINEAYDLSIEVFSTEVDYINHVTAVDEYDGSIELIVDDTKVDLNVLGSYEVILIAIDSSGNETRKSIIVTVIDTTAPTISLYTDFSIEASSSNVDYIQSAIAMDLYDREIEIIVDDSLVNLDVLGTYEVTLIAKDSSLNESQVVIHVSVVDTIGPEISGYQDYRVEVLTPLIDYLDGVTANDLYDGLVNILIDDSNVDLTVIGQYEVMLTATDSNENSTMVIIEVIVEDKTVPIFTYYQALYTHEIGTSIPDYLSSLVVEDNYDGLINNEDVLIYDQYINYHLDGVYPLIYVVTDASGNSNSQTVYVKIFDNIPPTINAPDEFIISLTCSNINYLEGITAIDNISGDLTDFIIVDDNAVIYDQVGVYQLKFIVTDLSGNTTILIRDVTVVEDLESPEISGTLTYSVEIGITEINYLDNLIIKDNFTDEVMINIDHSQVNLNVVGTYSVFVTAIDANQNSTTVEIKVNLIDTKPPIISGNENFIVEVLIPNIDYLEGVTARDLNDGLVTIEIDDSQVNLNEVGTYEVILNATDSSGNDTREIITVTVVDTTPPEFYPINDKTVEVNTESVDYLAGVTVTDNLDESVQVIVDSSQVDLNTIGSYQVTLIVSDTSGNNAIKYYQINVVDTIKPEITGYHDVTITKNETFNPLEGISVTDNYDSDLLKNLIVSGDYDVRKSGVYKIELMVSDNSSNTTKVKFNLVVEKTYQKEIIFGSIIGVGLIGIGGLVLFKRKR